MTEAASLVARVADFVATSLDDGVPVVTISRPAHRHAVEDLLVAARGRRRPGAPGRRA